MQPLSSMAFAFMTSASTPVVNTEGVGGLRPSWRRSWLKPKGGPKRLLHPPGSGPIQDWAPVSFIISIARLKSYDLTGPQGRNRAHWSPAARRVFPEEYQSCARNPVGGVSLAVAARR